VGGLGGGTGTARASPIRQADDGDRSPQLTGKQSRPTPDRPAAVASGGGQGSLLERVQRQLEQLLRQRYGPKRERLRDLFSRVSCHPHNRLDELLPAPWHAGQSATQSLTGHEETLYRQARPVPGVHLLLRQNPRVSTRGVRNATILSSLAALRAPDDLNARNSWPYRANTGPGSIHPSADCA
jgi:hypothetical protein